MTEAAPHRQISHLTSPRNGILGRVQHYLNTLGSWSTYRDLTRPDELPHRLAEVTVAFFGLSGLEQGLPKISGILGAIMALHALEQVTGSLATFGTRLLIRGEPLGHYRGVILRRSPLTPQSARALRWLIGSRLLKANGYYFHESGRTWHSQSFTVQLWDVTKTLTHLRSYSLPYREFYFDRETPPETIIELVKGDRVPEAIPGFIGSVNELENVTHLGYLKRAFFAANWLLIDAAERDEGGPGYIDYDALIQGKPPGSNPGGGFYRPHPPAPSSGLGDGSAAPSFFAQQSQGWPSTTGQTANPLTPWRSGSTLASANGIPLTPAQSPAALPPDDPYVRIKERYQTPAGRHCPLLVRGITIHPITRLKKADAIYYDRENQHWQEITDDETRVALAKAVVYAQNK